MSVLGTSIAAGVAQTAHAAQQVARRQDRQAAQIRDDAKRVRDTVETHLQSVEEGDARDGINRARIDGEVPEHDRDGGGSGAGAEQSESDAENEERVESVTLEAQAEGSTPASLSAAVKSPVKTPYASDDAALYQHLDVEA